MASAASASPSRSSFKRADSADDSDSWQYVNSNPASVGFFPSPASGSLGSWGLVGMPNQAESSPSAVAVSPLQLDDYQAYSSSSYAEQADAAMMDITSFDSQFMAGLPSDMPLASGQDFVFDDQFNPALDMSPYYTAFPDMVGNTPSLEDFGAFHGLDIPQQPFDLGIPLHYRTTGDAPPWDPTSLQNDDDPSFPVVGTQAPSPQPSSQPSPSPRPLDVKTEPGKSPSAIRRTKGSGKVEKKKAEPASASKFVIMTPNLINASAGRPNPFECFEAMRTTQRGRKGPLADQTKENALQVRRLGACFCCHSRKVKCDKERPCKNCKKLTHQVPQIVCWQFQDFLPVLFPDFIRGHFRKEQMAQFVSENVDGFTVDGVEKSCTVELFSGQRFQSTLTVQANFFTAKGPEVLQHWHLSMGVNQVELQPHGAVPIGVNLDNNARREELRKKAKEYIHALTSEPQYAEQVTDSVRHTGLPRKILSMAQRFAQRSESLMVKKALSIYALHYVLTRHLCLTHASMAELQSTKLVPRNMPWVTPRLLNRQIKALLDEQLLKETTSLFETFAKSLKPKSRKEWAPCLVAFLVLCLFMEAVETAADTFVVSQNEVDLRNRSVPAYRRSFALAICKEIENLPFKQFAYQFHNIYQTHTRDASTKAFNPLLDDNLAAQGELDSASRELVSSLRELLQGDSYYELDFLVADPILPNQESHPFPRDISLNYTGRLVARFMLSFLDEKYLFDGQY